MTLCERDMGIWDSEERTDGESYGFSLLCVCIYLFIYLLLI
jgi:hypothetical protein